MFKAQFCFIAPSGTKCQTYETRIESVMPLLRLILSNLPSSPALSLSLSLSLSRLSLLLSLSLLAPSLSLSLSFSLLFLSLYLSLSLTSSSFSFSRSSFSTQHFQKWFMNVCVTWLFNSSKHHCQEIHFVQSKHFKTTSQSSTPTTSCPLLHYNGC
jgi:hypothetical protein